MPSRGASPSPGTRILRSSQSPGTWFVANEEWQVGTRYELEKVLGTGSFSSVCLAWDTEAKEKVALKKVTDVFASPEYAKRVLREVCIMRRLEHPNIVRLKDVFLRPSPTGRCVYRGGRLVATSHDCYMAMECAEGGDLFNMRGQLPEHEVRSLMWQLLGALRYLHGLHVWHRDVKTANLLLSHSEGRRVLKVADFGSARSAFASGAADRANGAAEQQGPLAADAGQGDAQPTPLDMDVTGPDADAAAGASRHDDTATSSGGAGGGGEQRRRPGAGGGADAAHGWRSGGAGGGGGLVAVPAPDGGFVPPLTSLVCTPCYRAPEVVMSRGGYSSALDCWGAGCVFGELLQRAAFVGRATTPHLQVAPVFAITGKPLTPGTGLRYGEVDPTNPVSRSAYAELSALFAVIGTPSWACIEAVPSESWRRYLFHVPGRAPTVHRRFGQAGEVAVDLLSRLLQFDPNRRASAEEAMAHEYFALMHMEAQMAATELVSPTEARGRTGLFRASEPLAVPKAAGAASDTVTEAPAAGSFTSSGAALPRWPPGPAAAAAAATATAAEVPAAGTSAPAAAAAAAGVHQRAPSGAAAAPRSGAAAMEVDGGTTVSPFGPGAGGAAAAAAAAADGTTSAEVQPPLPAPLVGSERARRAGSTGGGSLLTLPSKRKASNEVGFGEEQDAQGGEPLRFWQIDEPALALATLEDELALLAPPDTPASSAGGTAPAAHHHHTAQSAAFIEECKERLRVMLERECAEHSVRSAASRLAEQGATGRHDRHSSGGGASVGGASGSAGGHHHPHHHRAGSAGLVRRNASEGVLGGGDGGVLGVPASLHGHLRPDPAAGTGELDPLLVGYERLPFHADAAAAGIEPEKHLTAGRHGEWTESSLPAQRRMGSSKGGGTWGVTLLPPGASLDEPEGRALMEVMRVQHAR